MNRWAATGMLRSSLPDRNQDGSDCHEGSPDGSFRAASVMGRWVTP